MGKVQFLLSSIDVHLLMPFVTSAISDQHTLVSFSTIRHLVDETWSLLLANFRPYTCRLHVHVSLFLSYATSITLTDILDLYMHNYVQTYIFCQKWNQWPRKHMSRHQHHLKSIGSKVMIFVAFWRPFCIFYTHAYEITFTQPYLHIPVWQIQKNRCLNVSIK